jgi:Fe-S-cluster containining protein
MKDFVCEKCGECCRYIDKVEQLKHIALPNGVCKYLDGDLCTIYETRPDVCNYHKAYQYFQDQLTEEQFYNTAVYYCNQLKQQKTEEKSNDR